MAKTNLDKLLDKWEPALRDAFLQAIYNLRDEAQIAQIVARLERGDIDGAIRAVGLDPVAFRPFDLTITQAFENSGQVTASSVPVRTMPDGLKVRFQFNIRNPAAESWLALRSSAQITEILDDQRTAVRGFLTSGMERGLNPRTVALDLVGRIGPTGRREGGVIGLTSTQEQWSRNYADELASVNPLKALERELRDKRFDATVRKAAANGTSIPAEKIQKMILAYRNNALRYRAEAIGRTEAMASLHEAQQQSLEQAISSGAIRRDQLRFEWHATHDSRTRDAHRVMDHQTVQFGEKFVDGEGRELEFPGDPSADIATTINCRCWREPLVDYLAGIR